MKNHLMQTLADCSGNWSGSHLGQHSFIFKIADKIIAFDPFLTPVDGRLQPPFIPAEEFENVDIIFGSHDHGDHIDHPSLAAMAAAITYIVKEKKRGVKCIGCSSADSCGSKGNLGATCSCSQNIDEIVRMINDENQNKKL
jgi:hypothetical protein